MGFSNSVERKARKAHYCAWCSEIINKGDKYVDSSGFNEGFFIAKLHIECNKALHNLPPNHYWEDYEETWGNGVRGELKEVETDSRYK